MRTSRTDCTGSLVVICTDDDHDLCHDLLHDHLRYNLRYILRHNLRVFYLPVLRGEAEPTKALSPGPVGRICC